MSSVLLTGSMGAGKSTLTALLKEKSYPVFQADSEVRRLLEPDSPCYDQLKQLFGESGLIKEGVWDKKKLAREIFHDPKKRKSMEAIIHPLVQSSFKKFLKKHSESDLVFYEAPPISKRVLKSCDKILLVTCPKTIKRKRLMDQGWKLGEIEARWAAQIPDSNISKSVDFTIDNSGDFKSLKEQLEAVLFILKLENKKASG